MFCTSLGAHAINVINFGEKNGTFHKKRAKFASRWNSMLHLWKILLKKNC